MAQLDHASKQTKKTPSSNGTSVEHPSSRSKTPPLSSKGVKGKKKQLPPLTVQQRWLLLMMCIVQFACYLMFAVIAPFFPGEATSKGATLTQIGFIFGVYQIVVFVAAPFMGKYITTIGAKFLYLAGLFVRGGSDILFGTLNRAPNGTIFVVMCFLCRMMEGLGTAAFVTAAWAIVAREFPERVSIIFGLLHSFNAIGLMIGPVIGGILYDLGGFPLPFYVLGGFVLVVCFVNILTLPNMSEDTQVQAGGNSGGTGGGKQKGVKDLIRIPRVAVNVIVLMFTWTPSTVVNVNLEQHLTQFGLSSTQIGAMFMAGTGAAAATNSFWGWLDNRNSNPRLYIAIGCVIVVCGCLLIGPSPFISFLDPSLGLVASGLVLLGAGGSALRVCGYKDCIVQAHRNGFPECLDTYGVISGVYQFCASFGAFVGPTFGNMVVQAVGFAWTITIVGGLVTLMGLLVTASKICDVWWARKARTAHESQLLLPDTREPFTKEHIVRSLSYCESAT